MLLRFVLYTVAITTFCMLLPSIVADGNIRGFTENRWVEWLQFALVFGSAGLLVDGARRVPESRELLMLIAGFYGLAAFRELDALLDELVPLLGWKIGPTVLLPLIAGLAIARARRVGDQFASFIGSSGFVLGWAGFMIPVAQLIGHGPFLEAMMGDHYHRAYKRVIEESGELVGYMMLAAAAIETVINPPLTASCHERPDSAGIDR